MFTQSLFRMTIYLMTPLIGASTLFQAAMVGKLAYLEQNYQTAFVSLKEVLKENHDETVYWQCCESAIQLGKLSELIDLIEEKKEAVSHLNEINFYHNQLFLVNVLRDETDHQAKYSLTVKELNHFYHILPRYFQLKFLDGLYRVEHLRQPSIRAFVVEALVNYELYEDAYELALMGFQDINPDWIDICQRVFSYPQQRRIFSSCHTASLDQQTQNRLLTAITEIYPHHQIPSEYARIMHQALKSESSLVDQFLLARACLRSGWDLEKIKMDWSQDPSLEVLWKAESAFSAGDYASMKQYLAQCSMTEQKGRGIYDLLKASMVAAEGHYEKALRMVENCGDLPCSLKNEAAYLKALLFSHIQPAKAMSFAVESYRKKELTYRELMTIEACVLRNSNKIQESKRVADKILAIEEHYIPKCDPYFQIISVFRD